MVAIADLDVHAVEARHQSRYHQHDRDAGHLFHYVVDVVADDRLEGIEHSGKDLGVDLHCVRRLAKLDFDKIYTDYSRLVYWAAYRVVSHRETAEDVTQTVFTKVLANKATLIKLAEPQLKSWLYRTTTNLALDIVRRNKYEQPDAEPISELIADDSPSPEKVAIDRDRAERVRQAVDSLDDAYREVVMLHYFSNLTVREISECTGISEGTIKSRLVRARTLLAERLKNEVSLI